MSCSRLAAVTVGRKRKNVTIQQLAGQTGLSSHLVSASSTRLTTMFPALGCLRVFL